MGAVVEEEEVNDLPTAIRKVLKNAMVADGCIRGLHEVAKYIDAGKAQVVFLAESCNEPTYKKLVQGLCLEKNVPLIDVSDNKTLGEWAGFARSIAMGTQRRSWAQAV